MVEVPLSYVCLLRCSVVVPSPRMNSLWNGNWSWLTKITLTAIYQNILPKKGLCATSFQGRMLLTLGGVKKNTLKIKTVFLRQKDTLICKYGWNIFKQKHLPWLHPPTQYSQNCDVFSRESRKKTFICLCHWWVFLQHKPAAWTDIIVTHTIHVYLYIYTYTPYMDGMGNVEYLRNGKNI